MGPSASAVAGGGSGEKMAKLVEALSFVQSVQREEWARVVAMKLFPDLIDKGNAEIKEWSDAKAGKPAPARPSRQASMSEAAPALSIAGGKSAGMTASPTPPPTPASTPASIPTTAVSPVDPAVAPPVVPEGSEAPAETAINSLTHRAEYARLTRKMASVDEADFPQIAKLWKGSRKEMC